MTKKCWRYYGALLTTQENWLNRMASNGYRLVRTEKLLYEFDICRPGQYQYKIDFVAHKSRESADDYARFLTGCGYRVFFKNINLNYSAGKVVGRPWAEKGGRIATHATTYDRELLIVEKENDGSPFRLHTTYEDQQAYFKALRRPWLFLFLVCLVLGAAMRSRAWGIFAILTAIPVIAYQIELAKLKKQGKLKEWE